MTLPYSAAEVENEGALCVRSSISRLHSLAEAHRLPLTYNAKAHIDGHPFNSGDPELASSGEAAVKIQTQNPVAARAAQPSDVLSIVGTETRNQSC